VARRSFAIVKARLVLACFVATCALWYLLPNPGSAEETAIPSYPAANPGKATILFGGDTHFQWGIEELIEKEDALAPVREMQRTFEKADFRILNVETAITDKGEPAAGRSHIFRASPGSIKTLTPLKLNLAILANNHAMDMGPEGLEDTRQNLRKAGILTAGVGANAKEASLPVLFRIGDIRFAVVAASAIGDERMWADDKTPGIAKPEQILAQIQAARTLADHVIVSLHWGMEYNPYPMPDQRPLAQQFIQAGASAVIGHHPHVAQGIETSKNTVICYSLGNFLFGSSNPFQTDNMIVLMEFEAKKPGVRGLRVIPITGHYRESGHAPRPLHTTELHSFFPDLWTQSTKINPNMSSRIIEEEDGIRINVD
jgi:poly-gamma-glutamate synthesis protein (capsule biosynthesis protein)